MTFSRPYARMKEEKHTKKRMNRRVTGNGTVRYALIKCYFLEIADQQLRIPCTVLVVGLTIRDTFDGSTLPISMDTKKLLMSP